MLLTPTCAHMISIEEADKVQPACADAPCIYDRFDAGLKRRSTDERYYDVRELCEPAIRIGEIV